MIKIDGSYGEGGGQILRYAACFAAATQEEISVYNIRVKRPNPGLRPQHLATLNIMKKIFGGEVIGARIGSTEVAFNFGGKIANRLTYNIGTAGSIPLILQSIIPAIAYRKGEAYIRLIGGTDVKWSPTIDYMKYAYISMAKIFNVDLNINIVRRGYYPKGGGIVDIYIKSKGLRQVNIDKRGEVDEIIVKSVVSNLPRHISNRQISVVKKKLLEKNLLNKVKILEEQLDKHSAIGLGVSLLVIGKNPIYNIYSGGDSLGEKGKPAEKIGEEAVERFFEWYISEAALDKFQSDMVIPYIALSGGGEYTAPTYTKHMESALYVMKQILGKDFMIEKMFNKYRIKIK